jgi:hypothetical protein
LEGVTPAVRAAVCVCVELGVSVGVELKEGVWEGVGVWEGGSSLGRFRVRGLGLGTQLFLELSTFL